MSFVCDSLGGRGSFQNVLHTCGLVIWYHSYRSVVLNLKGGNKIHVYT